MPKITDANRLKELQDKRQELYTKSTKFHSENESNWTDEHEKQWSAMLTDYDAVNNELEDHRKACEADSAKEAAAAARRDRLAQMEQHGQRMPKDLQNRLKFGGEFNHREDRFTGGPLEGMTSDDVGGLAMCAWFVAQSGEIELSDQHLAACKVAGLNPNSKYLNMNLLDTRTFNRARTEYLHAMDVSRSPSAARVNIQNALTTGTNTAGGYTFGESFVTDLEMAMISSSGIMEVADIMRTDTGEPMRWPTVNDTSNKGRQLGEGAAVTTLDPTFGQKVWYAYKFTSDEILVSSELLGNNSVNLQSVIPELLGERLGRIINEKGTTGSGAATMNGIVTAATVGKTAASGTAIAFDELIDLEHSVNRIHRSREGVGYMFSDTTLQLLRKLKDGGSQYLWQSGANSGAPDTLNTYRYTINDDMATVASGVRSVLFGRLRQYKLRMVRAIRMYRLTERHRENDQDAFLAFVEADGNLLDAGDNPVKCLVQA